MKYQHPLKKILSQARPYWDRGETRPAVRRAFGKALQCRTAELGAEVYRSENRELILYHTCKSRACPSCGYRAHVQWLRERWVALPNESYMGITFTMPDVLWPFFRDNPPLAKALPALAAKVIEARVRVKYGLRVGVIAILHTFNGKLEFNSHVHTMVTGGGLNGSSDTWVSRVYYEQDRLMEAWRRAVIALLRAALRAGQLDMTMTVDQLKELLTQKEKCWWSIKIQLFDDKWHFLQYAGRYVRRPPIAQRRITYIGKRNVTFWFKDKKTFLFKGKKLRAGFTCSARWKSSLIAGLNTFLNITSTPFGTLGYLPRALSGKPRQPSLQFWARSKGDAPSLAFGRSP